MAKKTYPSGVITPELGSTNWYSDYDTNSLLLDSNITKTNSLDSKVKELETSYTNVETSLTSLSAVAKSGDYNDLSNKPESIALAEKAVADGDNNVITKTYATKKEVVTSLEPYIKKTELADVATSGSYTDLSDKPTTIAHADRSTADKNGDVITVTYAKKTEIPNLDGYALSKDISKVGKTNNYKDLDNLPTIPSLDGYVTDVELSPVAKSGDYNDLSNTPEPVDLTPYATKTELNTKANDADVVHKSGTETIVGTKTFANQMYMGSGGTGYGQISAKDNNSMLRLYGGTTPSTGANLDLYGEGENGTFALRARTSDKILALYGKTDGTLKWDNNEILTIVNGVTLNTAQTITGQKLFTDEVLIKSLTVSRVPSSDMWGRGITFQDSTGKRTGFISNYFFTNGNMSMRFFGSSTTYDTKELFSLNWKTDETVTANINGVPLLTEQTGVTTVTAQKITGAKTFVPWQTFSNGLNVKWITGNKEQKALFLYATMNDKYLGYGATLQLLSEELNGGFKLTARDKTDTNVKALAGNSNGVLMWGTNNVLTDANQIMMLKNLTGAKITSGAVINCGTGNGVLVGWFMNTAGAWTLANNKPTGKWKNANNYSLLAEESGMFVKVG